MEGIRKNIEAAKLAAGIGLKMVGQPGLEQLNLQLDLARRTFGNVRISGGNGKPHCAVHAKRKRQLRNKAISHQRRLSRERS